MTVIYDRTQDAIHHKTLGHRAECYFCGDIAGYPRVEYVSSGGELCICARCAKEDMPGLWSDAVELVAITEIRRSGHNKNAAFERSNVAAACAHIDAELKSMMGIE